MDSSVSANDERDEKMEKSVGGFLRFLLVLIIQGYKQDFSA